MTTEKKKMEEKEVKFSEKHLKEDVLSDAELEALETEWNAEPVKSE